MIICSKIKIITYYMKNRAFTLSITDDSSIIIKSNINTFSSLIKQGQTAEILALNTLSFHIHYAYLKTPISPVVFAYFFDSVIKLMFHCLHFSCLSGIKVIKIKI